MSESIQQVWDRIERWLRRYTKVARETAREMCDGGYDEAGNLFASKAFEIGGDALVDFSLTEEDLLERIKSKISFVRGYLVDISFDGPVFMSKHSGFLTLQYPSRCERALGIWLEQDLEGEIEAGDYFGFQDFDVSLFVNCISDVDVASMRCILPFDTMRLRKSVGVPWLKQEVKDLTSHLKQDLDSDGYDCRIRVEMERSLLTLEFRWS